MEDRAAWLLNYPDEVLFRAGGCHVFALALREFWNRPLVLITESEGAFNHVACDGSDGLILDFFGWKTLIQFQHDGRFDDRSLRLDPISEDDLRRRFINSGGKGYYFHPDFTGPAFVRARVWIEKHRHIFDGREKISTPGVAWVSKTSPEQQARSLFG